MLPQQIVDLGFFLSAAARAGHYAAVALLFGTFLFALVVVRPTVGRVRNMADERRRLGRFLLPWLASDTSGSCKGSATHPPICT